MGKYFIYSEFGEALDIGLKLQEEGNEVLWHVENADYHKIGENMLHAAKHWYRHLGMGYTWYVDGTSTGKFQDWLRSKGEFVFGSSDKGAKLEENRQAGQQLFKRMGLYVPFSQNFKDLTAPLDFVKKHRDKKYILKQNVGPKSINHKTKFDGAEDMIFHLEELKSKWNKAEWGDFDADLMEQVEGTEIAVSAFFNGKNFLKGTDGKIAAFINLEHKKAYDKNLGPTCGEAGTVFITANSDNKLVKQLLENKALIDVLRKVEFRGVFDINGCLTKKGYVGFETTMRPGVPSSSWEFLSGAGLAMKTGDMIDIVAKGLDKPLKLTPGVGIVIVVSAPPYPLEASIEKEATSLDQRLWIFKDKKIQKDFDVEQRNHIHLENFYKDEAGNYRVATKNGYMYVVSMGGKNIKEAREKCMKYIKDNTYLTDFAWRTDIGEEYEKLGF